MKKNLRRLNKAMRITFLIYTALIACSGVLSASPSAGQIFEKRISVSLKNETLAASLKKVEQAGKVDFAYDPQMVNLNNIKIKNRDFSNERLYNVLKKLLSNTPIGFKQGNGALYFLFKAYRRIA